MGMMPSPPPQSISTPLGPVVFPQKQSSQDTVLPKQSKIQPIWLKPIILNVPDGPNQRPVDSFQTLPSLQKPPSVPLPPVQTPLASNQPFTEPLEPVKSALSKPEELEAPEAEDDPLPFLSKKSPPDSSAPLEGIYKALGQLTQLETLRSKNPGMQNAGWSNEKILLMGASALAAVGIPVWALIRFFKHAFHEAKKNQEKLQQQFQEKHQQQSTEMSDMSKTLFQDKNLNVKLDDVQGIEGVKAEIIDIIRHLKAPGEYNFTKAKMPKGVLLEGPPGNGKTMLAKAIAAEAGVPFFSVSGSDFVEKFVGVGASRVRSLFEEARKKKHCVIFIDEIDSIGRQRSGVTTGGGAEEHHGTLNQLLKELDGMASREGILVLAATNRADVLDKALVRPGRFDKTLQIKAPWTDGQRLAILNAHIKKHYPDVVAPDVDLNYIAELTESCTGAELANVVNEASRLANRRILNALEKGQTLSADEQKITQLDFIDGFENAVSGATEPKDLYPKHFTESLIVHEGLGHAWMAYLLDQPIYIISTFPRSGAYGYIRAGRRRGSDKLQRDRQYYLERLMLFLGGTVAEEVLYGKKRVSDGASSDLQQANKMLRAMMSELGLFNGELGFLVNLRDPNTGKEVYTENEKQKIEALTRKVLNNAYTRVRWAIEQIPADDKQRMIKALTDQRVIRGPQASLALFESNIHATQNAAFMKQLRAVLDEFLEDPTKEFYPPQRLVA